MDKLGGKIMDYISLVLRNYKKKRKKKDQGYD